MDKYPHEVLSAALREMNERVTELMEMTEEAHVAFKQYRFGAVRSFMERIADRAGKVARAVEGL
jgi:phosphate uptake regulator